MDQLVRGLLQLISAPLPGGMDSLQNFGKTRAPVHPRGRNIGGCVKGLAVGKQKHRHRPATRAVQSLGRRHIHLINIGPLFPIHLDRDKPLVEQCGNLRIFKGFTGHDMAPVTGGIADGEKNRFILLFGPGKGFFTPGIPIHRVIGVLQQIRTLLPD